MKALSVAHGFCIRTGTSTQGVTRSVCRYVFLFILSAVAPWVVAGNDAADIRFLNDIPLHTEADNVPDVEEQWSLRTPEARDVRNVTRATLTPLLPAPGKATGAAVIVAPGGGFLMLSIDSEGYQVARWLAQHGIAAFVLKYRTRTTAEDPEVFQQQLMDLMSNVPTEKPLDATAEAVVDGQAAVRLVRERAAEWGVDPDRVGFAGFSAGAMTAIGVALQDDEGSRPNFIAPVYPPMMSRTVPGYAPPMFLAIALDDPLFAEGKSLGLIDAWRKTGKPVEAHLYTTGGHGFGMQGNSKASAQWIHQFYGWMDDQRLLTRQAATSGSGHRGYSVAGSSIGELVDNPATKAVLDQHVPDITNSRYLRMIRGQTLSGLQAQAGDSLSDEVLAAIQADLDLLDGSGRTP
ncbi:alpha/beta hydrolase [Pseudomaricurvus sp. HS19]|uniref:alpha/beta hydrolase n=1 Tax=Pseudomaricurvus sp. HS19 TaxID=2692626 RepID=UPI00136FEFEB|nr:alpha/beta hydrolase [Pseudomaricurvus sp. HS19]MYM62795.1 alpha/beta hydrolase fold domain-containing protein [Pseudomaricurvus sp. HS19]